MIDTPDIETLRSRLAAHGQAHLLRWIDDLPPRDAAALLAEIATIDLELVERLIRDLVRTEPTGVVPADLEPAPFYGYGGSGDGHARPWDVATARAAGEALVGAGRVAAFTVAGGQGTRLGWRGPKGTFPATVVTGKPLFRVFAEQILATERRHGVTIPWYILTSPLNDDDTRAFFRDNNCFGLQRRQIMMFPQGLMPSVDADGRIQLADRGHVALHPDGHGGSLIALRRSGALEDMQARGIEQISYFQVDNPIVRAIDPVFIGLHVSAPDSSGEMSSKMTRKEAPEEKMGVLCRSGGRTIVVEYSDLPDELAAERESGGPDAALRYIAGSLALHVISVDFIARLTGGGTHSMPYHRAHKKVTCVDPESGDRIEPDAPNGYKFETFVFDALPQAERSIVLESLRADEFAPIKALTGRDSVVTSHQAQSDRAGAWLEAHGVSVPRTETGQVDARIEIGPLTALDVGDLRESELPRAVQRGSDVVL